MDFDDLAGAVGALVLIILTILGMFGFYVLLNLLLVTGLLYWVNGELPTFWEVLAISCFIAVIDVVLKLWKWTHE